MRKHPVHIDRLVLNRRQRLLLPQDGAIFSANDTVHFPIRWSGILRRSSMKKVVGSPQHAVAPRPLPARRHGNGKGQAEFIYIALHMVCAVSALVNAGKDHYAPS